MGGDQGGMVIGHLSLVKARLLDIVHHELRTTDCDLIIRPAWRAAKRQADLQGHRTLTRRASEGDARTSVSDPSPSLARRVSVKSGPREALDPRHENGNV